MSSDIQQCIYAPHQSPTQSTVEQPLQPTVTDASSIPTNPLATSTKADSAVPTTTAATPMVTATPTVPASPVVSSVAAQPVVSSLSKPVGSRLETPTSVPKTSSGYAQYKLSSIPTNKNHPVVSISTSSSIHPPSYTAATATGSLTAGSLSSSALPAGSLPSGSLPSGSLPSGSLSNVGNKPLVTPQVSQAAPASMSHRHANVPHRIRFICESPIY